MVRGEAAVANGADCVTAVENAVEKSGSSEYAEEGSSLKGPGAAEAAWASNSANKCCLR